MRVCVAVLVVKEQKAPVPAVVRRVLGRKQHAFVAARVVVPRVRVFAGALVAVDEPRVRVPVVVVRVQKPRVNALACATVVELER